MQSPSPSMTTNNNGRKRVLALHDYEASEQGGLSFQKGDAIQVLARLPSGWWEGILESSGQRGWFPFNFVGLDEKPLTQDPNANTDGNAENEQEQIQELPENWGIKELPGGKHYYFNLLTNETKWSLMGAFPSKQTIEMVSPLMKEMDQDEYEENEGEEASSKKYTWPSMGRNIKQKVKTLIFQTREGAKEAYLVTVATLVEAIHLLFSLGGFEHESKVFMDHPELGQAYSGTLTWLANLIFAAKLASGLWPAPNANEKLQEQAIFMLEQVLLFTEKAEALKIPITLPSASGSHRLSTTILNDYSQREKTDTAMILRLESRMVDILTLISSIHISHEPIPDDPEGHTVAVTEMKRADLIGHIHDLVKNVGLFLSIVDEMNLECAVEELFTDFTVNKSHLLNSITELVLSTRKLANTQDASEEESSQLGAILVSVEKAVQFSKELLVSCKFIIEEKEIEEHETLRNYIESISPTTTTEMESATLMNSLSLQDIKSPTGIRKTMSLIQPKSSRISVLSPLSSSNGDIKRMSLYGGGSDNNNNFRQSASMALFQKYQQQEMGAEESFAFLGSDYTPSEVLFDQTSKKLVGASLSALISMVTNHASIDESLCQTFLLTYRTVTTTSIVMSLLFDRFSLSVPAGLSPMETQSFNERKLKPIRLRVYMILKVWLELYIQDDTEDFMILDKISAFAENTMKLSMSVSYSTITKLVQKRKTAGLKPFKQSLSIGGSKLKDYPPQSVLPKNLQKFTLIDLEPLEVARQLTIYNHELYSAVEPQQIIAAIWNGEEKSSVSISSVDQLLSASRQTQDWVLRSILEMPASDAKKRAKVVAYFISLANECFNLGNFSSALAVINALRSDAILRLQITWKLVQGNNNGSIDTFQALQSNLYHPSNENDELAVTPYRQLLQAKRDRSLDCFPDLQRILDDLTKIRNSSAFHLPSAQNQQPALINYSAMLKVFQSLQEFQGRIGSQTTLNLKPVIEIRAFILEELSKPISSTSYSQLSENLE